MVSSILRANNIADSEIIGALLLLVIAIIAGGIIYNQVLPVPIPPKEPNVHLVGYVIDDGTAVIEHMGGPVLLNYEIYLDGELLLKSTDNPWDIGGKTPSSLLPTLTNPDEKVRVTVYTYTEAGTKSVIFEGTLAGKEQHSILPPALHSMPISTLRTNSPDEDLICYYYFVQPTITPVTYIYNWMLKPSGGQFTPFAQLVMPFDTFDRTDTRDYSGNEYHGAVTDATWTSNGRVGGAYEYTGNEYITLPYCFDADYLNEITLEVWIKTACSSGTIISYDRTKYFELAVSEGLIKLSTTANGNTIDTRGSILVNDDQWHLITVTYSSITGSCTFYVDGVLDKTTIIYAAGSLLGDGDDPLGYIAKGSGAASRQTIFSTSFEGSSEKDEWQEHNKTGEEETSENLKYDNFNNGWGSYTRTTSYYWDYTDDCIRTSDYKHEGSHSIRIRDDNDIYSSFYLTHSIDVHTPQYKSLQVDFWWMWNGNDWSTGEDWWLRYYDGSTWVPVLDMNYPSGHQKNVWYHEIVYVNESDYSFPTNMRIRFQCDASSNNDLVYIDQVYINATTESRLPCDLDLRDTSDAQPHSGGFSLGGTGDFDPEYALFNRTSIDLSGYTDVALSVWYSYKDTEADDFMGLYYKNGSQWTPIFEVEDPQIGSGQSPWTHVEFSVPDSIHTLVLQFKWMSSSTTEFLTLDDLEITGMPPSGENNFVGIVDELRIYSRVLSDEQIYQEYLCQHDGLSDKSVIVAEETSLNETWKCIVTPNDSTQDDDSTESDILYVISYGGG